MKFSSLAGLAACVMALFTMNARAVVTGAIDPSFGSGGFARITGQAAYGPQKMLVQSSGKIVYAASRGNGEVIVGRLKGDGAIDTGFGVGGIFSYTLSGGVSTPVIADDAAHRATILGLTHVQGGIFHLVLCRILDNGTLDTSFTFSEYPGQSGCVQTDSPPGAPNGVSAIGVAVDATGGIVAGGMAFAFSETPNIKAFVVAALPGGPFNTSVEAIPEGPVALTAMAMNPLSNRVFLTGSVLLNAAGSNSDSAAIVIRASTITVWAHTIYNPNLAPLGYDEGRGIVVRPDNLVVVTGVLDRPAPSYSACFVNAYDTNLNLSGDFADTGRLSPSFTATSTDGASCEAIAADTNNRVYLGGAMSHHVGGGNDDMLAARVTRAGQLDGIYGGSGPGYSIVAPAASSSSERALGIGLQNGRTIIAGPSDTTNGDLLVARLLEDDFLFASGVE